MVKKFTEQENALVLISIFTDIALESPKTYRNILQIISFLLDKFSTTDEREKIVEFIYKKFQRLTNIGELQIWLQRITFKLPHPIEYSEKYVRSLLILRMYIFGIMNGWQQTSSQVSGNQYL